MVMAGSGFSPRQKYNTTRCLPDNAYEMRVLDSYGDGVCCEYGNGYIKLIVNDVELMQATDFNSSETVSFGGAVVPVPVHPDPKPEIPPPVLALSVRPDGSSYLENSVKLTNVTSGDVYWDDITFGSTFYTETLELDPAACYLFEIFDSWGDGLCCGGYVELTLDNTVVFHAEDFGTYASHSINC